MKLTMIILAVLMTLPAAGCGAGPGPPAAPSAPPALAEPPAREPTPKAADSATPAPTTAAGTVLYINGDGVRVRAEADGDADIVCSLPYGAPLVYLGDHQEWVKVKYDDLTGYVRRDLLSAAAPAPVMEPRALSAPRIVVKKSARLLELWDGDALVGSYPAGLGWTPEGKKQKEGDGRTPEGDYYVCVRNDHSRFYLSLGVSYPGKADAKAALDEGRIGQAAYDRIAGAIDSGERPSWSTPLGGEIMIHGHGGDRDWTAGCVAVDNGVMDILWAACPLGTPIRILP